MNKRIKKKKKKQEREKWIKMIINNPQMLEDAIDMIGKAVKTIYDNIGKLINELLEMAIEMKTNYFVGEEVIADGVETEITAIAYDECGNKVYMVEGSNKDYYFDELRRISNANITDKEKVV